MELYFSRHAKRQMKWREISEDEVRQTVFAPESVEDSTGARKNAFRHLGTKWLKVTFLLEGERITIITVIDKSR